jgi:hypothetical protein
MELAYSDAQPVGVGATGTDPGRGRDSAATKSGLVIGKGKKIERYGTGIGRYVGANLQAGSPGLKYDSKVAFTKGTNIIRWAEYVPMSKSVQISTVSDRL